MRHAIGKLAWAIRVTGQHLKVRRDRKLRHARPFHEPRAKLNNRRVLRVGDLIARAIVTLDFDPEPGSIVAAVSTLRVGAFDSASSARGKRSAVPAF